ncbi:sigma-54-dependent transcriptional regulator [Thermodesulforhabdus norvegica]|uniref:Two-component system, NtrC family, response regulator n=1 Tax=Thermodesulforhabdus norvegica TaxID=39841 RepID=A0A1I4SNL3_9BACT|nr:sigma-54 dependent transcriptional regulator [Thermodesulforhabdus norvegica]SFM65987.1 two-component system, NtrC family, response regulator [Thermodesulforhabdus norvegica]
MKPIVLVVDDEKNWLIVLEEILEDEGYEVLTADNAREALQIAMNNDVDVVVTDMKMPEIDGITFLDRLHRAKPDVPIIMMTAYGTVEKAVEAMKKGAFDYICKPFTNEEFLVVVSKALEHFRLVSAKKELQREVEERYRFSNIVGKSPVMKKLFDTIEKIAPSKATVLITGESGTGKELIARAIHYHSPRRDKPFVSVNCGALPETLLESELFGHEKGAFTGAVQRRKGRFELAHEGTLFLDEISEMSPHLQVKLLRVLQEMEFERVGGMETIRVDVRVIAASNRDLKAEMEEGRFRQDLFYRLNVVHIHVPPLRERKEDIPLLIQHFLTKYAGELGKRSPVRVHPEAMRCLMDYHWPGNVRELENVIERALILATGEEITLRDLPDEVRNPEPDREIEGGKTSVPLTRRQEKALEFIRKHGYITNKYYAEINNISPRQSLRELDDLREKGVVVRIGKGRGARYVLA